MARFLICAAALAATAVFAPSALAAGGPWAPLATAGPQRVTLHILPAIDNREVMDDANIAIVPDVPVRLVVVNTSGETHTFTIPQLHVNVAVRAGSPAHPARTVINFTAPSVGTFTWSCELCPAVHHRGGMTGRIYALVAG
jgi:heme/copper-type cytochrome/quinol oxidase subunit 2